MSRLIGIYKIQNTINDKVYVGQSIDIEGRWRKHKNLLRNNCHENQYLQNSWNKYGEDNFIHTVLELLPNDADQEMINERECYYIFSFNALNRNSGHNIAEGGSNGCTLSGMTREQIDARNRKISESRKGRFKGKNNPTSRKVICINTKETFESLTEASKEYGVNIGKLSECCTGKRKSTGKLINGEPLIWQYYDDYLHNPKINTYQNSIYKKVICINNKLIFGTISSAAHYANINGTNIVAHLKNKQKTAGKHPVTGEPLKWMYYENYISEQKSIHIS